MNNDTILVELDKPRTLKFRRKELKMLEKMFNVKSVSKIDFENIGTDEMTKIIHLGLTHEDAELTLENAEKIIDEYPYFGILFKKAIEAFSIAMAGPDAVKKIEELEGQIKENSEAKN